MRLKYIFSRIFFGAGNLLSLLAVAAAPKSIGYRNELKQAAQSGLWTGKAVFLFKILNLIIIFKIQNVQEIIVIKFF